jgi:diaminopropionate ammonia-lyase
VVEPENAPALAASIRAAGPVIAEGPVSAMGRLDCKEPSLIALKGLAWAADRFMLISEAEGAEGARKADEMGFASTPSGAAGLAGLLAAGNDFGLDPDSSVLLVLSEGPEA